LWNVEPLGILANASPRALVPVSDIRMSSVLRKRPQRGYRASAVILSLPPPYIVNASGMHILNRLTSVTCLHEIAGEHFCHLECTN
jgi:hypothetical protein